MARCGKRSLCKAAERQRGFAKEFRKGRELVAGSATTLRKHDARTHRDHETIQQTTDTGRQQQLTTTAKPNPFAHGTCNFNLWLTKYLTNIPNEGPGNHVGIGKV
jgi:hypothetical protein